MKLNDISIIAAALKVEKTNKIKLFHKLLFNTDEGRSNRTNIRSFEGFPFKPTDEEFKQKLQDINKNFSLLELISIANILHVDIEGTDIELGERILTFLTDLESLKAYLLNNANSESEDEVNSQVQHQSPQSQTIIQSPSSNILLPTNAANNPSPNSHIPVSDYSYSSQKTSISFHDVENIIPRFNGEKFENVHVWLGKFENFSESFQLSPIQKFIFAEKSLGGLAALYLKSESNILSYDALKISLLSEFGAQVSAAEIHELLTRRRMKENESLFEYFLHMRDISNRAHIDDVSLMKYIIKGINDSPQNKSILYDCNNLHDFKKKLKVYEEIKMSTPSNAPTHTENASRFSKPGIKTSSDPQKAVSGPLKCFNCGRSGHLSSRCRDKVKGLKCFKCNLFGHKASDNKCPVAPNQPTVKSLSSNSTNLDMHKLVQLNGVWIDSLIDTGSQATLLREDVYRQMHFPQLQPVTLKLTGFDSSQVSPLGSFDAQFIIDHDSFSTTVNVVSQHHMTIPLIIGTDVIKQGTLTLDKTGITFSKPVSDNISINLVSVVENDMDIHDGNSVILPVPTEEIIIEKELDKSNEKNSVCSDTEIMTLDDSVDNEISEDVHGSADNEINEHMQVSDSEAINSVLNDSDKIKFPCDICHKEFTEETLLNEHVLTHSSEASNESYLKELLTKSTLDESNACNKETMQNEITENAAAATTTDEQSQTVNDKTVFTCCICHLKFSEKAVLDAHVNMHNVKTVFVCGVCQKIFLDKNTLNVHAKIHDNVNISDSLHEKSFNCEICSRRFSHKKCLDVHFRKRTKEKPFNCEICSKTFSEKSGVYVHLRTHTNEKPYSCEVCSRRFAHKSSLNAHLCTHTNEKPFVCEVCSKRFAQKRNLNIHIQTHTKGKHLATATTKPFAIQQEKKSRPNLPGRRPCCNPTNSIRHRTETSSQIFWSISSDSGSKPWTA